MSKRKRTCLGCGDSCKSLFCGTCKRLGVRIQYVHRQRKHEEIGTPQHLSEVPIARTVKQMRLRMISQRNGLVAELTLKRSGKIEKIIEREREVIRKAQETIRFYQRIGEMDLADMQEKISLLDVRIVAMAKMPQDLEWSIIEEVAKLVSV